MNRKKVKIVLSIVACIVIFAFITVHFALQYVNRIRFVTDMVSFTNALNEEYSRGSYMGNISGAGGYAIFDEGWIYYTNVSDEDKLYKIKADGTKRKKICDDEINGVDVSGDWLYYRSISEKSRLYRIKKNGKGREALTDDGVDRFKLMDGWIYYTTSKREKKSGKSIFPRKLWKMRLDGTSNTLLSEEECYEIAVFDDHIYCTIEETEDGIASGIYVMDTDGTIIEKIADDKASYINVADNWLYFCNRSDGYTLYKMNLDGKEREKISNDHAEYINVNRGWIYYSAMNEDRHLYKIRLDGSERQKICDDKCLYICVLGERLIYMNRLGGDGINMKRDDHNISIRLDGSDRRELN